METIVTFDSVLVSVVRGNLVTSVENELEEKLFEEVSKE